MSIQEDIELLKNHLESCHDADIGCSNGYYDLIDKVHLEAKEAFKRIVEALNAKH